MARTPFRLPYGVSEGRPDLSALLNAREPHERLIREGALERRQLAETVRDAARERAHSPKPSPSGAPEGIAPARYGVAALGFVPPGMVASGTLNALATGLKKGSPGPSGEPAARAKPPTPVGMYATRPRVLTPRHPEYQAARQRAAMRFERAAAVAALDATAAGAGWDADGGFGSGGGSGASPLGGRGSNSPGGSSVGSGGGGGGADEDGAVVRVGVPLADAVSEATSALYAHPLAGRASGRGGSRGGRAPPPGGVLPRTPWGTPRAPGDALPPAAPVVPTPRATDFFPADRDVDYAILESRPRAFKQATRDLPTPAVAAVRHLLSGHKVLTVSSIHQRRPPYLDMGPPIDPMRLDRELHPADFTRQLRKNPSDQMQRKRQQFTLGSTAPWNKSKTTPSGLDTFDAIAKLRAVRYYVTDFTKPGPPPLRPPSRGVTRFAANVPSLLEREGERYAAERDNRLLCVSLLPPPPLPPPSAD
jgi:hypothetical protein